jgi:hypothetical protein
MTVRPDVRPVTVTPKYVQFGAKLELTVDGVNARRDYQ